MKHIIVTLGVFAGLSLLFIGCKGDSGPAAPNLTGTLSGTVTLTDGNGTPQSNHSGVAVWIEGGADTVMTDSAGRWNLGGISTGIYTLVMAKAGFGYMKHPNTHFVGGGDLDIGNVSLVMPPTYVLAGVGAVIGIATPSLTVNGSTFTHSTASRSVIIYVAHGPVDITDPLTYIDTLRASLTSNDVFNSRTILVRNSPWNFAAGDTAYVRVYPVSAGLEGYVDPASGRKVFSTGISETGVSRPFRLY